MRRIGIRELRQNAGTYLRDVANGESIEITNHGHPIAHLIPATTDTWSALIASKEVIAASITPKDILTRPPHPQPPPLTYTNQDQR